jgi:hypothetical protein
MGSSNSTQGPKLTKRRFGGHPGDHELASNEIDATARFLSSRDRDKALILLDSHCPVKMQPNMSAVAMPSVGGLTSHIL